jgi:subtilisin family serine protease
MKRRSPLLLSSLLALATAFVLLAPAQAAAEKRFIVRASSGALDGLGAVNRACELLGCSVKYGLDGSLGRVFLATTSDQVDANFFVLLLRSLFWLIDNAEIDQVGRIMSEAASDEPPPALLDTEPIVYNGVTVRGGYIRQPAFDIVGIGAAQAGFNLTGNGVIVAVIDTGVDPNHPALRNVVLEGYDFTRGRPGASELSDLNQSTMTVLDGDRPGWVNQSTMTVLDQSTMTVLDNPDYSKFGHGTMVAGVVHLAAPRAFILPLKTFSADGSGYLSDIIRAVHQAVRDNAKVINMSFSISSSSRELQQALKYATGRGVVPVASVGNDGQHTIVYPAAFVNVIGVAATTNYDTLANFSNFGTEIAWIAAPGEAVITLYPFGTYAAAWGTSFSAPFAAGAAALLSELNSQITQTQAKDFEGRAKWITQEVQRGRLDIPAAISAWREALGLR